MNWRETERRGEWRGREKGGGRGVEGREEREQRKGAGKRREKWRHREERVEQEK